MKANINTLIFKVTYKCSALSSVKLTPKMGDGCAKIRIENLRFKKEHYLTYDSNIGMVDQAVNYLKKENREIIAVSIDKKGAVYIITDF